MCFPRLQRLAGVLVAVALTLPLLAITYGVVDSSNTYNNVGAFVVRKDGHNFTICSGTLIAPSVFLTASHCTAYFNTSLAAYGFTAYVTFDPTITDSSNLLEVTAVVVNPGYNQAQSDSGDIGALILASSASTKYAGIAPSTLPPLALLDQLDGQNGLRDAGFSVVGYGLQERVTGGGQPVFGEVTPFQRMYANSTFLSLNPGYLRLSQNPALGNGGTCDGDSGGPNFLNVNGTEILAAITITGDTVCRATNVVYRLDIASARQFLQYLNDTYDVSITLP